MSQHHFFQNNHLLSSMSPADFDLLQSNLEQVSLQVSDVLVQPNKAIEHVYFLDGGLGSVVLEGSDGKQSEIGMIGREGLIGIPTVLGTEETPHKTFMQAAGPARRICAGALQEAMSISPTLNIQLLRFANTFLMQVAETAYANARFTLNQRLARWLLMASDRLGTHDVSLTHQYLALMLGVRRPGVTETLHVFEGLKAVRNSRGQISILDRDQLTGIAGPSYGTTVSSASGNGTAMTKRSSSSTIS